MIEKLDMKTPDFTDANIAQIAVLFPSVVTETKDAKGNIKKVIDFDLLKQELSNNIVDGTKERYALNWPGKKEALVTANKPINKTLRPDVEDSVNFDTTQNLYIEGDNLEALKLLQESYLNKIKMIYIDPPYNTGKDFVYKDNFTGDKDEELEASGQISEEGRLVANLESNGRYHSDWLSMMYPRLKLARNLLKKDGVIFISIDEAEVSNLQKIMNEVMGEKNYICTYIWQNKKGGGNDSKYCAVEHEYILMYARNKELIPKLFESYSEDYLKRYKEQDEEGLYFWDTFKRKSGKQYYSIICPDGSILDNDANGNPLSWLRSEERFKSDLKKGDIKFEKRSDGWSVMFKQRLPEGKKPRSLVIDKGTTSDGSNEILELFGKEVFSNPKPVALMKYLSGIILDSNDIVLDFFSGSATLSQAVFELNTQEQNNRFILVQYPENLDENLLKFTGPAKQVVENAINFLNEQNKPHALTEIGKERIRKAGQKTIEQSGKTDLDIGFRVLKVDSSNMNDVYYSPDETTQESLFDTTVDNIKSDRTSLDLLFQVLLDSGVDLTLPIEKKVISGKEVYSVDGNVMIACFEDSIDEALVTEIAKMDDTLKVVFKDSSFQSDDMRINVEQIFKQYSPDTQLRVI